MDDFQERSLRLLIMFIFKVMIWISVENLSLNLMFICKYWCYILTLLLALVLFFQITTKFTVYS